MRVFGFVIGACLFMLGTATTIAQTITYDFDRAVNFARFETYAWVNGATVTDAINHERIVTAVNAQLARKRLTRVERDQHPDLLVAYHATFDRDVQITGFSTGWGPYRFGAGRSGVARAEDILVGTLVVDLIDARSRNVVWRGVASKEIDMKADPHKRDRNINRAAERLFGNYPPVR